MPRKPEPRHNKRHRYARAVFGEKDRRFPKRDPEIEAMYPGHLLPSSPQMLEELLWRSLELEQLVIMRIGATPAKLVAVVRAKTALAKAIARHRMPPHMHKRFTMLRAAS
jgi:hypothetical protein